MDEVYKIQAMVESAEAFSPEDWAERTLKKILDLMDRAAGIEKARELGIRK